MSRLLSSALCKKTIDSLHKRTVYNLKNLKNNLFGRNLVFLAPRRTFTSLISSTKYFSKSTAIVGGAAFLATCLYNLTQNSTDAFSALVSSNLRLAYTCLLGSVACTVITSRYFVQTASRINPLVTLATVFFVSLLGAPIVMRIDYERAPLLKIVGLATICSSFGFMLASFLPFIHPAVIRQAFLSTGAVFTGLCFAGASFPAGKFDNMAGILSVGFLVVFAASIANIFAPPHVTAFQNIFSYLGIPVVSGLTLMASNKLRHDATVCAGSGITFDPIN
ncbi:hypothetical protein HZS_4468, partial [Henneguya salminicola]